MKKSLYRYRSYNQYTVDNLFQNEIALVSPTKFNDPYDCSIKVDVDAIKRTESIVIASKLKPNMSSSDIKNTISMVRDSLKWIKVIKDFTNNIREQVRIACFSETNNNPLMWAHYSNGSTGFVLEYDQDELMKKTQEIVQNALLINDSLNPNVSNGLNKTPLTSKLSKLYGLKNVVYTDNKIDLTDTFLNFTLNQTRNTIAVHDLIDDALANLNDEQIFKFGQGLFFSKHTYWKYESEWRIVIPQSNLVPSIVIIPNISPIGIYVSEFTEPSIVFVLYSFALSNNIPLYRCINDMNSRTYSLRTEQVKVEEMDKYIISFKKTKEESLGLTITPIKFSDN